MEKYTKAHLGILGGAAFLIIAWWIISLAVGFPYQDICKNRGFDNSSVNLDFSVDCVADYRVGPPYDKICPVEDVLSGTCTLETVGK